VERCTRGRTVWRQKVRLPRVCSAPLRYAARCAAHGVVVGERVVAGNAEQHRQLSAPRSGGGTPSASAISRAAPCLASMKSRSFGDIDPYCLPAYAGGGFPVEAAFEQEGTSGVAGALEAGFEFLLEAIIPQVGYPSDNCSVVRLPSREA